jgi:hypothetical protein
MNNILRRTSRPLPPKREARKTPLCEGLRGAVNGEVKHWLSAWYPSPDDRKIYCRYLVAKGRLKRHFKAQIGLKEESLSPRPSVKIRLAFPTKDTDINMDLVDFAGRAGFKLVLERKPANGNQRDHRAYVISEDQSGSSSDITKIAETLERLLKVASEWNDQTKQAAEWKYACDHKGMMWALGPPYSLVTIRARA